MPVEVIMPKLGLTMETGLIGRWLKAPGDAVVTGEPLLEIATEKINYEIESPATGTVGSIIGNEGEEFPCGALLGTIAIAGDTTGEPTKPPSPAKPERAPAPQPAKPAATLRAHNGGRVIASPAARRLARECGIAIAQIPGTGPHGRITLSDVHAYRSAPPAPSTPTPSTPLTLPPALGAGRRAIYRKMSEVGTLPLAQVETVARVDAVKALMDQRADFGWTAYTVYACARLLRSHPMLRTDARTGSAFEKIDIGVAADTPRGLIVPVVRDADTRTLAEIQAEIVRLADAARDGSIGSTDIGGACFSISNVGPQKIERVAPLVDPPQTAILGIGAATRRPTVVNDEVVPAWMLTCVLSFDHRFVDGAPAARFLADLARVFGDPLALL